MSIDKKTLQRIFFGVISCIFVYWVLHETERLGAVFGYFADILFPFVLGAALAFILNVPMRALEEALEDIKKPGLRRLVAIFLAFVIFLLVLTIVFLLLIPQIGNTVNALVPQILLFVEEAEVWLNEFLARNPQLMQWLYTITGLESIDWSALVQRVITWVSTYVGTLVGSAASAIGSLAGLVVDAIIAVVFALYSLMRKETLARQCRRMTYAFLPEGWADQIIRVLRLSNSTFSSFLSGQCLEVCILGCMFAVSMAFFNMPYIPLVSVLVAVTAFIPVVGAWIGCIFGAFFILVDDPMLAVGFVVMFLVLQQIENNLVYPRVVGTSIGLPGMWVLFAVVIGGELIGVAGMFLFIPITSVFYTLLGELTASHLEKKNIDPEKLVDHPPELTTIRERVKKSQEEKKKQAKK